MNDNKTEGCWFCGGFRQPYMFSEEFDCYVHLGCLLDKVCDPDNEEAQIMAHELLST